MSGIVGGVGSRSGVIGTTELDYEEGIYSWVFTDGSCTWTPRASYTKFAYVKIGQLVTVHGRFETSGSSGTKIASLVYFNLPFTVGSPGENSGASMGSGAIIRGGNSVTGSPAPLVNVSSTTVNWIIPHPNTSGASETYLYGNQLDDSLEGYINLTYTVA